MRLLCPGQAHFFLGLCSCSVGGFQIQHEHQGERNSDEGRERKFRGQYDGDANFDFPADLNDGGFCPAKAIASIPQMGDSSAV